MNYATEKVNKELSSLEPDTIIELFEIDFSSLQNHIDMLKLKDDLNIGSEPIYRFHGGKNLSNPIYWQDNGYQPLPIVFEDMESKGDGTLPRPKLSIMNVDGLISRIVSSNDDFVGCTVTRKRTFAKFLDAQNFQNRNLNESGENPFGRSDPQAHLADDIFFINRKVAETKDIVQFELSSALELGSTILPGRIVLHNYCTWKYRCAVGCKYAKTDSVSGLPKADVNDKVFVPSRKRHALTGEDETNPTEGYGLAGLNIKSMEEAYEWGRYGIRQKINNEGVVIDGEWEKGTASNSYGYQRGDVVRISPTYAKTQVDEVPMVFVCIRTHGEAAQFHPLTSKDVWIRDNCSRGVKGCMLRWGYEETTEATPGKPHPDSESITYEVRSGSTDFSKPRNPMILPFGGFPGTSKYGF